MTPYSMPLKEAALVQNLKMLLGVEAVAQRVFSQSDFLVVKIVKG
jgi:hypothetical protein